MVARVGGHCPGGGSRASRSQRRSGDRLRLGDGGGGGVVREGGSVVGGSRRVGSGVGWCRGALEGPAGEGEGDVSIDVMMWSRSSHAGAQGRSPKGIVRSRD